MTQVWIRIMDKEYGTLIYKAGPFTTVAAACTAGQDVDLPDSRPVRYELLLVTELYDNVVTLSREEQCSLL